MNVTEKQKELIISFMQKYPDFGRGRLRYNSENKRKIDGLWEKLSLTLNTAAYGPRKSAKEWAKTWRDWKSNTLKKVAKHKAYAMGTGGGSPKNLQLTAIENALLDFLTPDASGLTGIPEGGFDDVQSNYYLNEKLSSSTSSNMEEKEEMKEHFGNDANYLDSYKMQSLVKQKKEKSNIRTKKHEIPVSLMDNREENIHVIEDDDNSWDSIQPVLSQGQAVQSSIKQKKQRIPIKTKYETFVQSSNNKNKENIWEQDNDATFAITAKTDTKNKYEEITAKCTESIKKPRLMAAAFDLLEKKSSLSENTKQKILELKEIKLELKREELSVGKEILQELQNMNNNLSSLREELMGQYLTTDP